MSRRRDTGGLAKFHKICWIIAGLGVFFVMFKVDQDASPLFHIPEPGSGESFFFESSCGICWMRLVAWFCWLRALWIHRFGLWTEDTLHDHRPTRSLPDSTQVHVTPYTGGDYQGEPGQEQYLVFEGKVKTNNPNIDLKKVMEGKFK